jgi:DNA polymerase III sliding clamp (beta) subunit (PCNA family)
MKTVENLITRQTELLESLKKTFFPSINISVDPKELLDGIKSVLEIISDRPRLPILSTILFKAENNKISITTSDLTSFLKVEIPAEVHEPGSVCVAAKLLHQLIDALVKTNNDKVPHPINIQQTPDSSIRIEHKRTRYDLYKDAVFDSWYFPVLEELGELEEIKIPELRKYLPILEPFTREDALNPQFGGITVTQDSFIACDGRNIAMITELKNKVANRISIPATVPMDLIGDSIQISDNYIVSTVNKDGSILEPSAETKLITKLIKQQISLDDISIPDQLVCCFNVSEMKQQLPLFFGTDRKKANAVYPIWIEIDPEVKANVVLRSSKNQTIYEMETAIPYKKIALYIEIRSLQKLLENVNGKVELYANSDSSLIAIKQNNLLLGCMPLPIINGSRVVVAEGFGYAIPSVIPYSYNVESKCLTVEYTNEEAGYIRGEFIRYDPVKRLAEIKKKQEEEQAWKEFLSTQPKELIKSAIDKSLTQEMLKKHFKSLKNLKSTLFGAKQKSWSECVRSYVFDVNMRSNLLPPDEAN